MKKHLIYFIIYLSYTFVNCYAEGIIKNIIIQPDGKNIQYAHDAGRAYLANDQIALDTQIAYAQASRYTQAGQWDKVTEINLKIAKRGHPIAQVHLGKQYVHGNGVPLDLTEAYKWFMLSETSIAKHYMELISQDMSKEEIDIAIKKAKNFEASYN